MNADLFDTMVRFVTNMASLSNVASIIVEHRRGLADVAPARIRMDLFRYATERAVRSREKKFSRSSGRLGPSFNVAVRLVHS